jgi:hypothetical protein
VFGIAFSSGCLHLQFLPRYTYWTLGRKTKGPKRTIPIISQAVLFIKRLVEKLFCLNKFRVPKYCSIFWNTSLDTVDLN